MKKKITKIKEVIEEVLICDLCKKETGEHPFRAHFKGDALDWHGAPVADGSFDWDLCGSCVAGLQIKAREVSAVDQKEGL